MKSNLLSLVAVVATFWGVSSKAFNTQIPLTNLAVNKGNIQVQFYIASELEKNPDQLRITCKELVLFALASPGGDVIPHCQEISSQNLNQSINLPNSVVDQNDYRIFVWEDFGGDYHLLARNKSRTDNNEFRQAEWRLQATADLKENIKKLTYNVLAYERSKDSLKKFFLESGAQDSKKIAYEQGQFLKIPERKNIAWETAYDIFVTESDKTKNYMRTSLELVVALGLGVKWYYRNFDFNSVDFDYPDFRQSMRTRLTSFDAVRFDNNGPGINKKHIYPTGLGYYLFARTNGLTQVESQLAAFAASSLWEYFVEFREVVSINDMVMTPIGGAVLGEAIFQLGKLFRKGGLKNKILNAALDPLEAFHQWLDNFNPNRRLREADSGFDPSIFARFEVFATKSQSINNLQENDLPHNFYGLDAEIINVPLEPGHSQGFIYDTVFTQMLVRMTADKNAIDDFKMTVKTSLYMAYHSKNLQYNENGELEGYSFVIGPTQGLDVQMRKNKDGTYRDFIMNVQVIGNTMDITRYYGKIKLRMTLDLFPNFAMLRSYAFDDYSKNHDISNVQSTLLSDSTYYAYGYTAGTRLSASFSRFELAGTYKVDKFYNFNKRTRYLETETHYLDIGDQKVTRDVSLKTQITKDSFIRCGVEFERRSGFVDNFSPVARKEKTRYCSLSYSFL